MLLAHASLVRSVTVRTDSTSYRVHIQLCAASLLPISTCPWQCINELDSEAPPPFEYTPLRRCGPGVELGHAKDFLLSCSCDGGSCPKEGCPCNKLSLEEAQRTRVHDLIQPLQVADVGYTHRRLLTERTAAYVVGRTHA